MLFVAPYVVLVSSATIGCGVALAHVFHKLPRLSPQEQVEEQYHVSKEMVLGHLRVPTYAQKSELTTKTYVVSKKDDVWGSCICDFRLLNAAVTKRATALGDVFTKTRALASNK